jgi:hypothetical protein
MKDKARRHSQKKQKKVLKARDRADAVRRRKQAEVAQAASAKAKADSFSDEDYLFWLTHGVNYLVSNYEQGTWTPLFPSIYENPPVMPEPEDVARGIMEKFNAGGPEWPLEGKAALAWAVTDKNVVYVYYRETVRRLRTNDPTCDPEAVCRTAFNGVIWQVFGFLKEKLLNRKHGG